MELVIRISQSESDKIYRFRELDLKCDDGPLSKMEEHEYQCLRDELRRWVLNEVCFQHMIKRPLE